MASGLWEIEIVFRNILSGAQNIVAKMRVKAQT